VSHHLFGILLDALDALDAPLDLLEFHLCRLSAILQLDQLRPQLVEGDEALRSHVLKSAPLALNRGQFVGPLPLLFPYRGRGDRPRRVSANATTVARVGCYARHSKGLSSFNFGEHLCPALG
jgi:hypothetical protein